MCGAKSKNCVLFISTVASFLPAFMNSAINVVLPKIGEEFAMDAILLGWVATSYLLALAMFLVPLGRAADIHGRKKIFTWGMVLFTLFAFLTGASSTAMNLIAFRFLHGISSAMIFGTAVALLTSVFPPGERGMALGINVTSVYVGLSAGPFLGGALAHYLGWRSVFFITVPLGLCVIALIRWKLEGEWKEAEGESFDWIGSITYSLVLVATIYGLTILPSSQGLEAISFGMLALFGFVWWETRTQSPILNVRIFRENRVFALSNLAALINYGATFAVAFVLSLYLQYIKGLTPLGAGSVLMIQPVVQALFSPCAGILSDRVEPRIVASAGMGLTAVGLLLLVPLSENTEMITIKIIMVVLGLGFAFFSSPNTNAIMSSVEKRYYGVASGMVGTMRSIGMMTSMAIAMTAFAFFIGRVQVSPEVHPQFLMSLGAIFSTFVVLCFVGIFASLARGKMR